MYVSMRATLRTSARCSNHRLLGIFLLFFLRKGRRRQHSSCMLGSNVYIALKHAEVV